MMILIVFPSQSCTEYDPALMLIVFTLNLLAVFCIYVHDMTTHEYVNADRLRIVAILSTVDVTMAISSNKTLQQKRTLCLAIDWGSILQVETMLKSSKLTLSSLLFPVISETVQSTRICRFRLQFMHDKYIYRYSQALAPKASGEPTDDIVKDSIQYELPSRLPSHLSTPPHKQNNVSTTLHTNNPQTTAPLFPSRSRLYPNTHILQLRNPPPTTLPTNRNSNSLFRFTTRAHHRLDKPLPPQRRPRCRIPRCFLEFVS
jgi:hypothetical protein